MNVSSSTAARALAPAAAPAPKAAAAPVNDHDADDLPGATQAAATAKAPTAPGTGQTIDKVA